MNDILKIPFDEKYFLQILRELIDIPSPTGFNNLIETKIISILDELGYEYEHPHKGGVIANLGGSTNPIVVTSHLDTLGLMVRHINNDGTLKVCNIGGLYPFYCVTENVNIFTRDNTMYRGSICRNPNSVHVTEDELRKTLADYNTNVCVVIDEDIKSKEDTIKLGIETGDYIALEPRFEVVNGYIKSRFVDDKVAVALMICVMKLIKERNIKLNRKIYFYFASYEEIGHGTTYLPTDTKEMLAVDIAPTGDNQTSDEHKVSIFAKDSRYPYHYEMTNELRKVAIDNHIDYVMDIFTPHYGTDCDPSVAAGYDIRHSAIGFGTLNSHGYERTHMDGVKETYKLLIAYLL